MVIIPEYTLGDIHIGVGDHEFEKGKSLYEKNKVLCINENLRGWTGKVQGTSTYEVAIDAKSFDRGFCDCYLGKKDTLCKHMIALAIAVTKLHGKDIDMYEGQDLDGASCNSEIRENTQDMLIEYKMRVRDGMKYIKSYSGPSSKWFQYQSDLLLGARKLLFLCSELPICESSVDIIISILVKLDKKISQAIDDSDGSVGNAMEQMVDVLCLMGDIHPPIISYISRKLPKGEVWEWDLRFREQYKST